MDARSPQICINQENFHTFLCEDDRTVNTGRSFSLLWQRDSNENNFWRCSQRGEQKGSSQCPVRLRHLGLWSRFRNQLDRFFRVGYEIATTVPNGGVVPGTVV